ncbi:nuclear transport factor 2 family protein [Nocardioides acrostichi]|nr:nuclear transport factor 2 family protein [Nocardioides acrostichi]
MSEPIAVAALREFWRACEARDWPGLAATLARDVVYTVPQTRERVRGRDAYVRFNAEYPGDWHLVITRLVGDERSAVSFTSFTIGEETMTGVCAVEVDDDGLLVSLEDWWPEPYEPPAGRSHLVERF